MNPRLLLAISLVSVAMLLGCEEKKVKPAPDNEHAAHEHAEGEAEQTEGEAHKHSDGEAEKHKDGDGHAHE